MRMFHPHRNACLCCGFRTFDESPVDSYAICPVCFWEADPVQAVDHGCDGGANRVCLKQARRNFAAMGASQPDLLTLVRPPMWHEWPM